MLKAENITVKLGRKEILHGIDFEARAGAVTSIVGPNGSGKTTFLRALIGDVESAGRISMNGRDISGLKAWKLASLRGVLPQATPLAFPFTVLEVVRLGLLAGVDSEQNHLPHDALTRVGLSGYEDRFYQELSGGEQQRVQLARVLCQVWTPLLDGAPRWLFLDEPVSSLDIAHQLQVMRIAREFAAGGGGVIMVMHDLNLTAMYSDHVLLLRGGRVVASGKPETVFTNSPLSFAYGCEIDLGCPLPSGLPFFHPMAAEEPNVR
jgi:iron complex transport system ATP-binding protein